MAKTIRRNGKTITDATTPLVLDVRPRDARDAVAGDDHNCALARCLKRQPGVVAVSVGARVALVEDDNGEITRYWLRAEDRKMARAFDQTGYFRPGEYILMPPPPAAQIGARKGEKQGSNKREGKARTVFNRQPLRHLSRPL